MSGRDGTRPDMGVAGAHTSSSDPGSLGEWEPTELEHRVGKPRESQASEEAFHVPWSGPVYRGEALLCRLGGGRTSSLHVLLSNRVPLCISNEAHPVLGWSGLGRWG